MSLSIYFHLISTKCTSEKCRKTYLNIREIIRCDHCPLNIHSFISIQPLGRFSRNQNPVRRPVWLWHCILGKFLGVGCHCFPPPLDVPTFSARCLHVQRRERPLAAEGGTFRGREMFRQISSKNSTST